MKSNKITYIDLFAGCGGLSEGFSSTALYEGLAHVEWEVPMIKTLRNRLIQEYGYTESEATKRVVHFDIQRTRELLHGGLHHEKDLNFIENNSEIFSNSGLNGVVGDCNVDLIIGGPPCQAYSLAGRAQDKNSMKDDYRNYLFESFAKIVNHYKPKMFLFENVGGILSAAPGNIPVLSRIYDAFKEIGYTIREPFEQKKSLLNSNDFGVAQNRKRVIIIGLRNDLNINIEEIYQEIDRNKVSQKLNVRDVLYDLPKLFPLSKPEKKISHKSEGLINDEYHKPRFHNARDIELFREWIDNDMNRASTEEKLAFYNKWTGKFSNHNKYRNLEWDKPSPTIVSHLNKDGLLFIHPDPEQSRTLTVKEAALIQSFPNNFEFLGNQGYNYKMIGNAVPPLMAKQISIALSKFLR